jgi:tetratricopeptide (TPR) repeat protein
VDLLIESDADPSPASSPRNHSKQIKSNQTKESQMSNMSRNKDQAGSFQEQLSKNLLNRKRKAARSDVTGKVMTARNKMPAAMQITAEQILRESKDRSTGSMSIPKLPILDREELDEYRGRMRKQFEDKSRRNRANVGNWLKYAAFEEAQFEYDRARSIFERAIETDHRNQAMWLKYLDMEMRNKNVNRARNLFDRVTALLPRVDAFWYKYTYMEELLENVTGSREVFERWMGWEPGEEAWLAYIKFELRYKQVDRARQVQKRFVTIYPVPKNWIRWAKFEESVGQVGMLACCLLADPSIHSGLQRNHIRAHHRKCTGNLRAVHFYPRRHLH